MRLRHLAVLFGVLPFVPATAEAQRPMSIVDLISVPTVSAPQLSPDGSQVVYVRGDADWSANKRISHLWRVRLDGTGTQQLTSGKDGETAPRWSPDGKAIAFVGKRDGAEHAQIQLLPMEGGEARALTSHATAASSPTWSPDGRYVYFLADDGKSPEQLAREKVKDDVYAFDENVPMRHLWRIEVATKTESRVTSGEYSILNYELSNDGRRIVHHRAPSTVLGDADRGEIWLMDADGGNAAALTKNSVAENGASLSPDGSQVLFLSGSNERFETYYNANLFVMPAAGGAVRDLTRDFGNEITDAAWSKDGRSIYVIANMGVHSQLFEIPTGGGTPKAITSGNHAIGGWTFAAAHRRR